MAEKAVNNGQNNEVPCGIRQRLDYNADFRLDWHDPDEATDGYQLKWIGKDYARLQSGTAPETVIIPDKKHNAEPQNKDSQNIFITGDNLQALKHLQNAYYGSVDMIYIDPPYNTGSDGFVYNDKFEFTDEQLQDNLGLTEEQIKRLKVINGRSSHSAWLTFMYPRLRIARTLLKDTGVIFISIDDNEQANLKLLCDEIFGERNLIANFIRSTGSTRALAKYFDIRHDYVLMYSKNIDSVKLNEIEKDTSDYINPDNDILGPWSTQDLTVRGGKNSYTIPSINLKQKFTRNWAVSEEELKMNMGFNKETSYEEIYKHCIYVKEKNWFIVGRYVFKGEDGIINNKKYAEETATSKNNTLFKGIGSNKSASSCILELLGAKVFNSPKPVELLSYLLFIATNKDSLVLDFFAGSATTAHAVMKLNKEDGENRHYIMVQLDELTWKLDKNGNKTAKEGSEEAFKAGFMSIDQIARERIRRAAKQIGDSTGFKHFYVKSPDTAALNKITEFNPDNPNADKLFSEDIVQELGGTDVILQTWMAADGYMLTDIPQEIDIAGYKAYYCGNSVLYLIENGWQQANTKALLNLIGGNKINVNTIICCAYSFTFESMSELETNIRQSLSEISVEKRY